MKNYYRNRGAQLVKITESHASAKFKNHVDVFTKKIANPTTFIMMA